MDFLTTQPPPNLPFIEFTPENTKPGTSCWLSTRAEVVRALENYGCFIATYNHKYSIELHDAIFAATKELFDLPLEKKLLNESTTPSHGYVAHPVIPLYEGFGIENATAPFGLQNFTNLMWPSGNPTFCETTLLFSKIAAELEQVTMRMVSEGYGIEKHYESLLESTSYLLRPLKYRGPKKNETDVGLKLHTDKSFMSVVHQHQVKGLEIRITSNEEDHDDDQWIIVDPSPSSFLVIAGDAGTAWTNGRIQAPHHRVIMKGTDQERFSLGSFSFIRDLMVETPQELIDEEHPLQYQPFDHYKYIHFVVYEGRMLKCPLKSFCGI